MDKPKMVWVDTETTGLIAREEALLEVGIALTDEEGNVLAGDSWIINEGSGFYVNRIQKAKQHEIVGPMHKKSGLWVDLEIVHNVRRDEIEGRILDWFDNNNVEHGKYPMAGSSVQFDRSFLAAHIPGVEAHFHYRNIDISTVKELCRILNPRIYEKRDEITGYTESMHRAYPDILDSIKEYKFYYDNFLWVA